MQDILKYVLYGLAPGALIAGVALGVVLAYRGSGAINMATGAVAVYGAYVFYGLKTGGFLFLPIGEWRIGFGDPMATLPAVIISLAACAVIGVLIELAVIRPLRGAAPLARLLGTLGVYLLIPAVLILQFGADGQSPASVFPTDTVELLGARVPVDRFYLVGVVIVATIALTLLYRYSRFGLATRAASENEINAQLAGLNPDRLSMINIVMASVLVGGLGVLAAPTATLDPLTIPNVIVPALGAALLARFTSFPIAAAAGIGMGVIQSLLQNFLIYKDWFPHSGGQPTPGTAELVFFLIIVGALFWRGASLPERGQLAEQRLPIAPAAERMLRPTVIALVASLAFFMFMPSDWRQAGVLLMIGTIVCLSLVVITGFIGQTSLVQIGLSGVTGFVISKLAEGTGIGFPFAPILGIAAAVLLGVLVATSALRVRGVNLAIVTLAAAVALEQFGFANPSFGAGSSGSKVPEPSLLGLNLGNSADWLSTNALWMTTNDLPRPPFALMCAVIAILCGVLVASVRRSDLGHRMLALRSNERAAAAAGIDVSKVKLIAFALSSFLAGVAGALYAYNFGSVTAPRFGVAIALQFVAFAFIGGITTVQGAILGGMSVPASILGLIFADKIGVPATYQLAIGGLVLIMILRSKPEGLALTFQEDLPHNQIKRQLAKRRDSRAAEAGA